MSNSLNSMRANIETAIGEIHTGNLQLSEYKIKTQTLKAKLAISVEERKMFENADF